MTTTTTPNRFGGTKKAPQMAGGAWFKEGTYTLQLALLKYEPSRNPKKKGTANFVAEWFVETSTNPEVKPGAKRTHILTRKPGVDWDDLEPKYQAAEGDINNLTRVVMMAMGVSAKQLDDMTDEQFGQAVEELIGPNNPGGKAKARVKLVATEIKLGNGNPFTKHEYSLPDAPAK